MRLPGSVLVAVGATLAWGLVAPPAQASIPALVVSAPENFWGDTQLNISVRTGAMVGAGDLIITEYKKSSWQAFHVYLDPDSGSAMTLAAGEACSQGTPQGLPPLPAGTSLMCDYIEQGSRITINLEGSEYAGGDFTVTNMTASPSSFHGSAFADYYQGGPGKDSADGDAGDDILFGGDGDDWILGGDGADRLDGEGGSDVIFGDLGPDDITGDGDKRAGDYINCNNMDPLVANTDNDPDNPPVNTVSYDTGVDKIVDCGMPGAPTVAEAPSIPGTPQAGLPVVASPGTWTGKALVISYAWFSCPRADDTVPAFEDAPDGACTEAFARDGAPGLTFTPRTADEGRYLKLRAIARNNSGSAGVVSEPSAPVAAPSPTPGSVTALSAKITPGRKPSGKRFVTVTVTWSPPTDRGPGVKDYILEVAGVEMKAVTTAKTSIETILGSYPRGQTLTFRVAARGPQGALQQGPWAQTSAKTPNR